ncbi:JmjC domain-containing histone demethylation protein 1 [Teratosphaeria destructans]|uniref:JmjC domain-containing histone demethylation protein 1 n=1 Tax=Teratosphaeria destructans TaxID=418781 RepID=A0A9W7SW83_9PEZI|nr:JmjC domain-containing histone demethylation protein 1 [Teratosphaeria destructans]
MPHGARAKLSAQQRVTNKRESNRINQRARTTLKKSLEPQHLPEAQYEVPDASQYPARLARDLELARRLQQVSSPPETSEHSKERTMSLLSQRKGELCNGLLEIFSTPPSYEVKMVATEDELTTALNSRFHLIYVRPSVLPPHRCSIQKFIECIHANSGQAYLAGVPPDAAGHTTHTVDIQLLRATFTQPLAVDPESRYSNYLDIANCSHTEFRPEALLEKSLLYQIRLRGVTASSPGVTASSWARDGYNGPPPPTQDQWVILTYGPGASPMHVDSAGYSTFIVGIEGKKYWHVPKGDWEVVRKEFAIMGQWYTGYHNGISVLEIGPGDCIIQAPGTPHAVFTAAGPCMIAGAFIYTAAHFARSLKCVRLGLQDRLPDNDDMKVQDYRNLTTVIQHLDSDLFTDAQREEIDLEVHQLLVSMQVIVKKAQRWTLKPVSKKSGGKDSGGKLPVDDARADFLDECYKWWQSRYQRKREQVTAGGL